MIMKNIYLTICLMFSAFALYAESNTSFSVVQNSANSNAKYVLYPTQNMWAFLKLDTSTGRIKQVHWGNVFREINLNGYSLLNDGETPINGRFALYPTQNMFNFILLDTKTGHTWQVQWSNESKNRGIIRIPQW